MIARAPAPGRIGGVLGDAVRLYRASFARCLPVALVGALFGAAAGWYPMLRMNGLKDTPATLAGAMQAMAQLQAMARAPGVWGSYGAAALIWLMVRGALLARQSAVASGRLDTFGSALAFALRRLPGMVLGALIWIAATGVGTLLLVIPGMWLGGQLQLWMVAMFAEDIGALRSLGRSWQLIEGNWWRTSTIVSITVLLTLVPSLFEGAGATIAIAVFRSPAATALIDMQLLSLLISVFTMPMVTVVMLAIYRDLTINREPAAGAGAL